MILAGDGATRGATYRLRGQPDLSPERDEPRPPASKEWNSHGTNYAANFGDRWFLKCFRHFEVGMQPDAEVVRHLNRDANFERAPKFAGTLQLAGPHGAGTLATLSRFLSNGGTGWLYTLDAIGRFFERVLSTRASVVDPAAVEETISGMYRERFMRGGASLAELHRALAVSTGDPDFQPEPFGTLYQRSLYQSMRASLGVLLRMLRALCAQDPTVRETAERVIAARDTILNRYARLLERKMGGEKIRIHGNLSLNSLVNTGKEWCFVDFDGGEGSIGQRRLKRSPLIDVACLLHSTEQAMRQALAAQRSEDFALLRPWADRWLGMLGKSFIEGYRQGTAGASFVPTSTSEFNLLLDVFLLDHAVEDLARSALTSTDAVIVASQSLFRLLDSPYGDSRSEESAEPSAAAPGS